MNARLAHFLFFQEVLYKVDTTESSAENDANIAEFEAKHSTLVLSETLSSEEAELLEKILSAVKLSFSSIDLIILEKNPNIVLDNIIGNHINTKIINFGVDLSQIYPQFSSELYLLQQKDAQIYLYAENLSIINKNADSKKKLWAKLKNIY